MGKKEIYDRPVLEKESIINYIIKEDIARRGKIEKENSEYKILLNIGKKLKKSLDDLE